jgi:hypothetical protein
VRHADGRARGHAAPAAKDLDNRVGKAVDNGHLLIEARCRVDHAQHLHPGLDAVKVAQFTLQRPDHSKRGLARRFGSLFHGQVGTDLTQGLGNSAVFFLGPVPGDN